MDATNLIIAGQVSSAARTWLESHGVTFEEFRGLSVLTLPGTTNVSFECKDEARRYNITFLGEGKERDSKEEGIHAVVEPELLAYETRIFMVVD